MLRREDRMGISWRTGSKNKRTAVCPNCHLYLSRCLSNSILYLTSRLFTHSFQRKCFNICLSGVPCCASANGKTRSISWLYRANSRQFAHAFAACPWRLALIKSNILMCLLRSTCLLYLSASQICASGGRCTFLQSPILVGASQMPHRKQISCQTARLSVAVPK